MPACAAQHATLYRLREAHGCGVAVDDRAGTVTISGSAAAVAATADDVERIVAHVRERRGRDDGNRDGNRDNNRDNNRERSPAGAAYASPGGGGGGDGGVVERIVDARGCLAAIIGAKGAQIKQIGAASRHELSRLLDRKIHLFLHVKVEEGWAEAKEIYEEIGLDWVK